MTCIEMFSLELDSKVLYAAYNRIQKNDIFSFLLSMKSSAPVGCI